MFEVVVTNSVFNGIGNEISGGICITQAQTSRLRVENCTFRNNFANCGSAINADGVQELQIKDSRLMENVALNIAGAVWTMNVEAVNVSRCEFLSNSAPSGGALRLKADVATIVGCLFQNNTATVEGGVALLKGGVYKIYRSKFKKNKAQVGGGLLVGIGARMDLTNSEVIGNEAELYGGAMAIFSKQQWDEVLFTFHNTTFKSNKAVLGGNVP